MIFPTAYVLLAVLAATKEVDAGLSPFRNYVSNQVSRSSGWFAGTDIRGGSMGKLHSRQRLLIVTVLWESYIVVFLPVIESCKRRS
jgi:hypothetical protein